MSMRSPDTALVALASFVWYTAGTISLVPVELTETATAKRWFALGRTWMVGSITGAAADAVAGAMRVMTGVTAAATFVGWSNAMAAVNARPAAIETLARISRACRFMVDSSW